MISLFLEEGPRQQLLMRVFLLLAGLLLFPALLSVMMPAVKWMNSGWSETSWWQSGWRFVQGLMVIGCAWFTLLGAGRLLVYSCVKAGLLGNPWI
ncbi:hypothetical protein [Aurantiacibacter hainanensis]|uniref:hypothetical protein n=1 Tax=Aurantiacibacter hainanensis TaxID=3076114 RepID=UPI0030C73EFC